MRNAQRARYSRAHVLTCPCPRAHVLVLVLASRRLNWAFLGRGFGIKRIVMSILVCLSCGASMSTLLWAFWLVLQVVHLEDRRRNRSLPFVPAGFKFIGRWGVRLVESGLSQLGGWLDLASPPPPPSSWSHYAVSLNGTEFSKQKHQKKVRGPCGV
jgi:hypothetical protein